MNCSCAAIELSIIIPLYNEEHCLPALLRLIELETQGRYQLIFSDGDSTDGTLLLLEEYRRRSRHAVVIVAGSRGRGAQMNRAAQQAQADVLLFLHADSCWNDPALLVQAVRYFKARRQQQSQLVAGHFPLVFSETTGSPKVFRYLTAKSALNIPGTIYGDQGMMLTRRDWQQLGGFSESLPVLEDVALAAEVWRRGGWFLLPGELVTSSRRYRQDGVWRRQVHNALLLVVQGGAEPRLLEPLLSSYAVVSSPVCQRSGLKAFCRQLHRLTLLRYGQFWYGCGHALARYSWLGLYGGSWLLGANKQIARRVLNCYQRWIAPWWVSTPVAAVLALVCWLLFYLSYFCRPDCWSWQFLRLTTPDHKRRTQ